MRRLLPALLLVWLIIGVIAAGQRGYLTDREQNCASAGTIFVPAIAGPLNYVGANSKVNSCHVPQPSS
ncbi:hypothetical protein GFY24_32925 [Nocardia sp. SYP-A9097]|uniref:hypothetical protein n=1 Tax=Nocardia sp. SYP-A9097 TaxID=2663237 RepID=UPI00129A6E11|nr:hypothetical protein [Nocardia sp. SYP-A9097]MRH92183.1 hypothetical protein [Nocardia sp. SYP-A9097]